MASAIRFTVWSFAVWIYLFSDYSIAMLHGVLTYSEIEDKLLRLGELIETAAQEELAHSRQKDIPEWQGADTCVTSYFSPVEPHDLDHDLVVRTTHAKELTWLFFELRDTFDASLDAGNKYGFFESLAQAAIRHLASHQPESEDYRPLLKSVLADGFNYLNELRAHDQIIDQSPIVIHGKDSEGRQSRETPDA